MSRTLCVLACLVAAPIISQAETYIVGSYDAATTPADVAAALGEPARVEQLNDPATGGGIGVFKIITDRDTGRSKGFARMSELGLVPHAVEQPADCALETSRRNDDVALAQQAADAEFARAADLDQQANAAADIAKREQAEAEAALAAATAAQDAVQKAAEHHTAAHEAAHTVQQRVAAAQAAVDKKPSRANRDALAAAQAALVVAQAADAAAEAALNEAEAASAAATAASNTATAEARLASENQKRLRANSTLSLARAKELNTKAGLLINAAIVELAEDAVARSASVLQTIDDIEVAAEATASFASKLGQVAKGTAAKSVAQAASSVGDIAAAQAKITPKIAKESHGLVVIPQLDNEDDVARLPQMLLLAQLEETHEAMSMVEVMMAMGLSGGLALRSATVQLGSILDSICDTDCNDEVQAWRAEVDRLHHITMQTAISMGSLQSAAVSNVLKTKHDTAKNSVSNIR